MCDQCDSLLTVSENIRSSDHIRTECFLGHSRKDHPRINEWISHLFRFEHGTSLKHLHVENCAGLETLRVFEHVAGFPGDNCQSTDTSVTLAVDALLRKNTEH